MLDLIGQRPELLGVDVRIEEDREIAIGSIVDPDFCRRLFFLPGRLAQEVLGLAEVEPDQLLGIGAGRRGRNRLRGRDLRGLLRRERRGLGRGRRRRGRRLRRSRGFGGRRGRREGGFEQLASRQHRYYQDRKRSIAPHGSAPAFCCFDCSTTAPTRCSMAAYANEKATDRAACQLDFFGLMAAQSSSVRRFRKLNWPAPCSHCPPSMVTTSPLM